MSRSLFVTWRARHPDGGLIPISATVNYGGGDVHTLAHALATGQSTRFGYSFVTLVDIKVIKSDPKQPSGGPAPWWAAAILTASVLMLGACNPETHPIRATLIDAMALGGLAGAFWILGRGQGK